MRVYLDHNATSPLRPEVAALRAELEAAAWANPASPHAEGRRAHAVLEEARETVARAVGAEPRGVVFTSGATEANHLALLGVERPGRPRRLVSAVEHPSVLAPARRLGAERVPVDPLGRLDLDALDRLLDERVALVAVQAANNETGVVQPLEAVAERCRAAGAWLLVDAVQAVGRRALPGAWDLLVLSAHKAGGPKGIGALVLRPGIEPRPLLEGGPQERGRRAGTVPAVAAACLARVLDLPLPGLLPLRERLEAAVIAAGGRVTARAAERLPNTVHLVVPGLPGEAVVAGLDLEGVAASTGSACAAGAAEPSHVLAAMGLDPRSGVRLSMGWNTRPEEVDRAGTVLAEVIDRCRAWIDDEA